jgi:hypothetical protein
MVVVVVGLVLLGVVAQSQGAWVVVVVLSCSHSHSDSVVVVAGARVVGGEGSAVTSGHSGVLDSVVRGALVVISSSSPEPSASDVRNTMVVVGFRVVVVLRVGRWVVVVLRC